MHTIVPVILSGGSGTRLWPLSRKSYPKQFLRLLGEQSLFQSTLARAAAVTDRPPLVVTNQAHRFLAGEQLREAGVADATLLLEPAGRNTAPAIAAAALQLQAAGTADDTLLLVLPSDHAIADTEAFRQAVEAAAAAAAQGKLLTFGIRPHRPETGYGYIRAGHEALPGSAGAVLPVAEFVEKPDGATARRYVESGDYYWNSGMFLFRADRYLAALQELAPDILQACRQAVAAARQDLDFVRLDATAFAACPADSIDYAVMERTRDACVVPLDAGWNDVGAWSSLWELAARDADGNALRGDVLCEDTRDCFVHADHRLVATVGVKDLIIVETPDAVLVADRHASQEVKRLVERLHGDGRHEHMDHRKVYRPWGKFDSIDRGERFQVKRITVKPGASLSLQKHHHRAEHWIVVSGTAEVTCDDEVRLVSENESTFIPLGARHRLRNPGKIPLEIIEIQSGSYLGEDDIIRFDDHYGRTAEET